MSPDPPLPMKCRRHMLHPFLISLVFLWSSASLTRALLETRDWLIVTGDLNGDTVTDVALVERATGMVRVGLGNGTAFAWQAEQSVGAFDITSAVAYEIVPGAMAIAIASSQGNQVLVVDPSGSNPPLPAPVAATDSRELLAAEFSTIGVPGADNLLVGHPAGVPGVSGPAWTLLEDPAVLAPGFPTGALIKAMDQMALIGTIPTGDPIIGLLQNDGSDNAIFTALIGGGGGPPLVAGTAAGSNLPFAQARWVQAAFGGAGSVQVLAYAEAGLELFGYALPVQPTVGPVSDLFAGAPVLATKPVRQLVPLEESGQHGLLMIFEDGSAEVWDFDGASAPQLRRTMNPSGAAAFGLPVAGGGFWLGEVDANGKLALVEFDYNSTGHSYARDTVSTVPSTPHRGSSNLLVFDGEPFVASQPVVVARLRDGAWTASPVSAALPATFDAEVFGFGTSAQGLQSSGPTTFINPAALGSHVLTNQYRDDASFSFGTAPAGANRGRVIASPQGGRFSSLQNVTLSLADGATGSIFYQLDGGEWLPYLSPVGPLLADATIRFYADDAGLLTPIGGERYLFDLPAGSSLDSSGDGMPDWLRIDLGLDPLGPLDSDDDTFSDLEEALQDTLVLDPNDSPSESLFSRVLTTFDASISANIPDETGPTTTDRRPLPPVDPSEDPVPEVAIFDFVPALLGEEAFVAHSVPNLGSPAAFFSEVDAPPANLPVPLLIDRPFPLNTTPEPIEGSKMVALLCPPPTQVPDLLFEPTGNTAVERISNWRSQATAALNAARVSIQLEATPVDTLVTLVAERVLGTAMAAAGITPTASISLLPFREEAGLPTQEVVDQGGTDVLVPLRTPVGEAELEALRDGNPLDGAGAVNIKQTLDGLRDALLDPLDPGFAALAPLRTLVAQLYELQLNPPAPPAQDPPAYLHPIDVLRRFLVDGQLEPETLAAIPMDAAGVAQAFAAVAPLVSSALVPRPLVTLQVQVTEATRFGDSPVRVETTGGAPQVVALFPSASFSTSLAALDPTPGTQMTVMGLRAFVTPQGFDDALEVRSATVSTLPAQTVTDVDGNGLDDAWERAVLGRIGGNAAVADSDGDTFSDLQEMLEGTNAGDGSSVPAGSPFPIPLPAGAQGTSPPSGPGQLVIEIQFPSAYANQVKVEIFATVDLKNPSWTSTGVLASPVSANLWRATVTQSGSRRFYIARVLPK